MIGYYIFVVVFGLFAVVFLLGMVFVVVQHRRQPLQQRLGQVREDLLKKVSKTGSSELNAGMYSKVSNEMLRDVAESEGFRFDGKSGRYLRFQRALAASGGRENSATSGGEYNAVGGDFGEKGQRQRLQQVLSTAGSASLVLRRDELGALPKAEILEAARKQGWAYQAEEISGDEWRLFFGRGAGASEVSRESAT